MTNSRNSNSVKIREMLRVLVALHLVRGSRKSVVRQRIANFLVWGRREHRRPAPTYIDPRILAGTMSWNDPARKTGCSTSSTTRS
jgi:hypothetical protein